MRKAYGLILLLLVSSMSLMAQNEKAAKYNNKMIGLQHEITPSVVKFFKSFETGTVDQIKKQKTGLIAKIDKAIAKVNKMPDFEGDADLKKATLEWFKLYESSLEAEYNHIIELVAKRDRSKEDHEKLNQLTQDLIKKEELVDQQLEAAQMAFAKRHNLDLKEYPIKSK